MFRCRLDAKGVGLVDGWVGVVRGYKGPIGQEGSPYVTDMDIDLLRDHAILEDLNGLSHSMWMLSLNAGDKFGTTPLGNVILLV